MTAEIIPFRGVTPQSSGGRSLYCESRAQHKREAMGHFYTLERRAHVDHITAHYRMEEFGKDYDRHTARVAEAIPEKECG
jgi:hypothetical protein